MENSEEQNGEKGHGPSVDGPPQEKGNRFFEFMFVFWGITTAALCNEIFKIFEGINLNALDASVILKLIYSFSFLIFILKYFIDDVVDEEDDKNRNKVTRCSVACFVVAWTFIMLAAFSVSEVYSSSLLLTSGLGFLSLFILITEVNNKNKENKINYLYIWQNLIIGIILLVMAFCLRPLDLCSLPNIFYIILDFKDMVFSKPEELVPVIFFFFFCFISLLLKGDKKCCIWRLLKKISCSCHGSRSS